MARPNTFITVKKMTANSTISNLNIVNWPVHLFSVTGSSDVVLKDMLLDNRAGEAPNNRSGTKAAAHNSDAFGVKTSSNILIQNSKVYNQDDCVAVTSGDKITVDGIYCQGSHGLSIGSIGGKSDNNVTNVLVHLPPPSLSSPISNTNHSLQFTNSQLVNSTNGARIKSNFNTTGYVANITYSNIHLKGISDYGIDIQQDYLNGGPTGSPSNGVVIENVKFQNISGTATAEGTNYYVLCGEGSCKDVSFENVRITGGGEASSCNFPASGCPT